MKIRTGFVSNSSSSSFLIYGVEMEQDEAERLLLEKLGMTQEEYEEKLDGCISELAYEAFKSTKLSCEVPYDGEYVYIGLSWSAVGGEETGNQFKARVESLIEGALGKKMPCGTYREAWMS
jgi:hypothetical protein